MKSFPNKEYLECIISKAATEFAVHKMIEIILLRSTLQHKLVSHIEKRTWTGLGIRQILLLIISKAFLIDHSYFALVLHVSAPLL